ncbi:MAG: DUF4368 domain-containing protein, partial [[Eubacterium] siraeum]|nr:DUF4368 domain-containing protein [[Eubacterium] siraeum]
TANASENDLTPFKNVFNEWYARDTSKKIRAVFKAKGNSGKHLSSNPPFGYVKSPEDKNQWIIDEPAASVVRKIFDLFIEGKSVCDIAHILTEEKIDTPQLYYMKQGRAFRKLGDFPEIWNKRTVIHILSQQAYAGRTINFQTAKKSYKSKKQVHLPKEEWVIIENTQEAVIEPRVFDMVQKMREHKRAYTKFNEVNMFAGMLYCADCGAKLTIARFAKNRGMDNYTCSTYRKKKKGLCSYHRILVSSLERIVLTDIRKVCAYVAGHEQEFIDEYRQCSEKEIRRAETVARTELNKAVKRNDEINAVIRKLYEDNVTGRISDERFDIMAKAYDDEQSALKVKIAELQESLSATNKTNDNLTGFIRMVKSITEIETLTPELLHTMVEKIIIGETKIIDGVKTQEVKIIYNLVGAVNLPQ